MIAAGIATLLGAKPFRRVGRNAIALFLAQVATRLISVWLSGAFSRALGAGGLGRFVLALTVHTLALGATDLGLHTYAVRALAPETARQREGEILGPLLGLRMAGALAGVLAINLIAAPIYGGARAPMLRLASLLLIPEAFTDMVGTLLRARQRIVMGSALLSAVRLASSGLTVGALAMGWGERGALGVYVASHALGAVPLAVLLWHWRVALRFQGLRRAEQTLRQSLPFAVASAVAIVYRRADLMILSYWHSDVATGTYAAAYRLWEAFGLVPASLLDALFPELVRRVADPTAAPSVVRLRASLQRITLVVLVPMLGAGLWLAPWLIQLLYGALETTSTSARLLRLLLVGLPFTYLYLLDGHFLYALGKQRSVALAMAGVTAVNVLANLVGIPSQGYWGAAVVALGSEVSLFVILRALGQRAAQRRTEES